MRHSIADNMNDDVSYWARQLWLLLFVLFSLYAQFEYRYLSLIT